jgi:hypothetical protein
MFDEGCNILIVVLKCEYAIVCLNMMENALN